MSEQPTPPYYVGPVPDFMLTTMDNPYSPHSEFDEWYVFDEAHGYHTTSYLGRVVVSSHELSENDQEIAIQNAIDEILANDVFGLYLKVAPNSKIPAAFS